MLAIIKTGGKQYVVTPGMSLKVEKLGIDAAQSIEVTTLLRVDGEDTDSPVLTWAPDATAIEVTAEEHNRSKKVRVVKYKPKVHYRRNNGHRQHYTQIKVTA